VELAKLDKGSWKYTEEGKAHFAEVEPFIDAQVKTVPIIGGDRGDDR
jgi:hypothetical protein